MPSAPPTARAARTRSPHRFRGQQGRSAELGLADLARFFSGGLADHGQVSNPASKVAVVYACIRSKADAIGMMPLRVSTGDDQVVETGPLVQLLERPHPQLSGRAFRRAVSAWLDSFGEVHLVRTFTGRRLISIEPVSPLELRKDAGIWRRTDPRTGRSEVIEDERVYTIIDPDFGAGRLDRGLSPRQAVANAISQQYHADIANDHALRYGVGGGMGLRSEGNLTPEQREDLRDQLEDRFSGPRGRHLWMILEGLKAEPISPTFRDQEFTDLKQFSREDICVAFGLNPLVLGYGGRESLGSGQHTDAAHEVVWNDTHLPRAEWIAEEITDCIAPWIEADQSLSMRDAARRPARSAEHRQGACRRAVSRALGLGQDNCLWFDSSGVSVLAKSRLEQAEQLKTYFDIGVPLNDLLSSNDLPYEDRPWGNTWYKSLSLQDVQAEDDPIDDPTGPPTAPASPGSSEPDPSEPSPDDPDGGARDGAETAHTRQLTEQAKARIWEAWRLSWAPLAKTTEQRVKAHWRSLRKQTLRKLSIELGDDTPDQASVRASWPAAQTRDLIARILFDLVEANQSLIARVTPMIRESFRLGGEQAIAEHADASDQDAAELDPFRLADPEVAAGIRRRELMLTNINRRVRNQIGESIAQGIAQQETTSQIAERVRKQFNLEAGRANTVARTEIGRSVEEARHQGRLQVGTPLKSWLWSRRETGRPWHFDTETQTFESPIPAAADFRVAQTGNTCPHPRATNDPEDDINCGCTTIARFPGDSVKQVLARYLERGFTDTVRLRSLDERRTRTTVPNRRKEAA